MYSQENHKMALSTVTPLNYAATLENLFDRVRFTIIKLEREGTRQEIIEVFKYIGSEIVGAIESLKYLVKYDAWVQVENSIAIHEMVDPEIAGFIIILRTRLNGNKFVEINLNN